MINKQEKNKLKIVQKRQDKSLEWRIAFFIHLPAEILLAIFFTHISQLLQKHAD